MNKIDIISTIAGELRVKNSQVEATVKLIDEGNTIPFIARYRKEVTGGMDDVTLRTLDERLTYLRNLEARKEEVIRLIDEQGKLTEELKKDIEAATVMQRVEDLYKPYKKKKATRASKAREKGLEPLAMFLYDQEDETPVAKAAEAFLSEEVPTVEEAIQGACDIVAEMLADDAEIVKTIRDFTAKTGAIKVVANEKEEDEKGTYEMYYDYKEPIAKIPNHRILAVNRGEKENKLKVSVAVDEEMMRKVIERMFIYEDVVENLPVLQATVEDAYKRLMAPSVEREMRNMLTERAEAEAVKIFGKNTENLLMVPPVKDARIISIDPGYRTGCKVAVLNETGKLLAYTTIYPTQPKNDIAGTEATLTKLADKYKINTIVIGNGTASRETEEVVANYIKKTGRDIRYTIVNEAGASVYSASKLATEEYPDLDVTTRGAMSLGRRLQDPLAELVKVPIKSIGVGQYQHDINQKSLEAALDTVVEDCVNRVGVDLNTASPSLLQYVSGINTSIAKNIVAYREANGKFVGRSQLKEVPKLGPKAYEQCAGFLRIIDGKDPLDGTGIHPESYKAAKAFLKDMGLKPEDMGKGGEGEAKIKAMLLDQNAVKQMAEKVGVGAPTLRDIMEEIIKPGRDPRDDAPEVIFRQDVKSIEDMEVGMELEGTVRNVVDFGAFVDVGVKHDGLVHISQLSDKFVSHPMDVVSVGDTVKVKIIKIDKEKGKIGLTMRKKDFD